MDAPPPPPAPGAADRIGALFQKPGTRRGAVALIVILVLASAATAIKKMMPPPPVKVILPQGGMAAPKPKALPPPPPAQESPEVARAALEEKYGLAAKALMAQDVKNFLALKTPNFLCKQPEGASAKLGAPSIASTTLASFTISTFTVQGNQVVVENTERISQNVKSASSRMTLQRSELTRRDTWIKSEGAWRLSQTELLAFRKIAAPVAPKRVEGSDIDDSVPNETIADKCTNEIGILCYSVREDIKAAKKCLKKYEGSWLTACRKAIEPPDGSESFK